MTKIVDRIERDAGLPGLVSILAERLSPTDLQSILLEVYRLRCSHRQPSDVLSDYRTNRFVQPSSVSPTALLGWEQIAFTQLPQEFEPIALAPVCPLGTNSIIASVDQNWAVATARNTEVVSDSTNVLALECAVRRRELLLKNPKSTDPVHLAASHRLLRPQRYESPALLAHFSLFALCSADRDSGRIQFGLYALGLQIRFYLRSLRAFFGAGVPLLISISDFYQNPRQDRIESQLLSPMRAEFENVACVFDKQRTSGRGYYLDLCFKIHATASNGQSVELVDGGSVNWAQKFLSNTKERLVISGIGSERLIQMFSNPA